MQFYISDVYYIHQTALMFNACVSQSYQVSLNLGSSHCIISQ